MNPMPLSVSRAALWVAFLLSARCAALAQDINGYEICRGEYFTQATTNRADSAHALLHELYAYVLPAYEGSVLSATLIAPKGQQYALTNQNGEFYLANASGGAVAFPAAASAGTYACQVRCVNEGLKTLKVGLPGPALGIPPVRVANFLSLQAVEAAQAVDVSWDKVSRRGAHDYLQLHIVDSNHNTVFSQNNISLEQTNLTLPAGTLAPNCTNTAFLSVIHFFAHSARPGAPQLVTAERRATRFHIVTLNPAGVFKISPLCVAANETAGFATMTVQRTQGSAGQVSVDYFSTDGSAQSNVNYLPVSGTLVFEDGVSNQTFTVPLLNDGVSHPPLTVHLTLTNATGGAALVVRPHAVLTVLDSQSAPGPNINACLLGKVEFYEQTNSAKPLQSARSTTSRFFVAVHPKFPGGVTRGTLKMPNGNTYSLGRYFENYQAFFEYDQDFPSPAAMTFQFRPGKYEVLFDAYSEGLYSSFLTLGVERAFSVPHLTNWTEAQAIEPARPFVLQWEPFAGATTNDYVLVSLRNEAGEYVLRTPDEFEPGALVGPTPSLTLPADLLDYGSRYLVNLIFVKVVNPARDPRTGIHNAVAFMHTTIFYVQTAPPPQ